MVKGINKKTLMIFTLSLISFLALAIPFRGLLQITYIMEVRPAAVLNPVLGMFFGMPAILATTVGNLILDIESGVPFIQYVAYIIPQFLYGYVPYIVWKKLNKNETNLQSIDEMPKILRFIISTLFASITLSTVAGAMVGLFNNNLDLFIDFVIFTFVNNEVMNLFLGIPLMIGLDKFVNNKKLGSCEKYLIRSAGIEMVCIFAIIAINLRLNVNADIADSLFWEKTYFMCIAVVLFVIGISICIISLQLNTELKEKNSDINIASIIQTNMLPTEFDLHDERINIYASMRPAKVVGGDFYDFYYIDENHFAFLIADVSGKGIPASLFMMRAMSTIKNYAKLGLQVDEIIQRANESISENNDQCYFVTAWMGIIDINSGVVSYCNAGHNPPVIKSKNNNPEFLKMERSVPLGSFATAKYKKNEFTMSNKDVIYLYTDGVTEANNKNGEMYTDNRLLDNLSKLENNPKYICDEIIKSIDEFAIGEKQFDDITMLALRYDND